MGDGPSRPDWGQVQERLLEGDRLAFLELNRLITGVLGRLRAYDFRDEWEDLRQEITMAVIENGRAGRLRDPDAFVGYVRIITRNKFVDRLKQRLRRHERDTLAWDGELDALLGDERDEGQLAVSADLAAALSELPEDERRAVHGVYAEGRTYQEVADLTGIPLGTLKRRLRDGLGRLRAALASELFGGGPGR